jgi:hypothetical protein
MKIILDERYSIENELWGYKIIDGMRRERLDEETGVKCYEPGPILYPATLPKAVERYLQLYMNENVGEVSMQEYVAEYTRQVDRVIGLLPSV